MNDDILGAQSLAVVQRLGDKPQRQRPEFRARIPMERYGRTDEISATIAFLASEGAGYITGQNLRVDGGVTRSV